MSVTDATKATRDVLGPRFLLVNYPPTVAAAVFVLVLVLAGAPGPLRFTEAWRAVGAFDAGQAVLAVLALTVVALLLHPLQLPMVRLLEGYWPRWLTWPWRYGCFRQRRRRDRLANAAGPVSDEPAEIQRATAAAIRLRAHFSVDQDVVLPTTLGNTLAAGESRAGREYGFAGVVAWPRLYAVLDEVTRSLVDDRRNVLDVLARMAVTGMVTALVSGALLTNSGAWLALALAPLAVAVTAYRGAVTAALAYGESLRVAFDLNRFALLRRLHLPLPADQARERIDNAALCLMWSQAPDDPSLWRAYDHPKLE